MHRRVVTGGGRGAVRGAFIRASQLVHAFAVRPPGLRPSGTDNARSVRSSERSGESRGAHPCARRWGQAGRNTVQVSRGENAKRGRARSRAELCRGPRARASFTPSSVGKAGHMTRPVSRGGRDPAGHQGGLHGGAAGAEGGRR